MKLKNIIFPALIILVAMSFKAIEPEKVLQFKTGTYGTCGCDEKNDNRVELTISPDSTFQYFNNCGGVDKIVDVKGKWMRDGNTIVLKDFDSQQEFPVKWQIDENEKCLKARKGLEFIRLCHLQSCK